MKISVITLIVVAIFLSVFCGIGLLGAKTAGEIVFWGILFVLSIGNVTLGGISLGMLKEY